MLVPAGLGRRYGHFEVSILSSPAAVEGFDGGRRKAAHAERKPFQGGARVRREVMTVRLSSTIAVGWVEPVNGGKSPR